MSHRSQYERNKAHPDRFGLPEYRAKLKKASQLPEYMRLSNLTVDSMIEYIMLGRPVGHFLSAVFSNDMLGAFSHADQQNAMSMGLIVQFLYNEAPAGCWGSAEKSKTWMEHRGMEGIARKGK